MACICPLHVTSAAVFICNQRLTAKALLMQALISAVFSIVFQAISQGFFPRFHVHHTSDHVRPPSGHGPARLHLLDQHGLAGT